MRRDDVLAILRTEEPRLRAEFFVKSLELFGSVARDEAGSDSDVDLLVAYDRPIGLLHHVGTALHLEEKLGVPKVDLILRRAVLPELREIIFAEAIDVFGPQPVEAPHPAHA